MPRLDIDKELFTEAVYDIVKRIPKGRATSYGAIAKAVGYPNMSRLVGKIMSDSESSLSGIPAHRVVNSQGILSGKDAFKNNGGMQKLLEDEGIFIKNDKIIHWKKVFWNPLEEIRFDI